MLKVNKIFKSIKDKKIISDISFDIDFGEIFGLLGPNGAGKTSTFYIIAGLTRADKGNIILESKDITKMPMHSRSNLGLKYLPQEPSIFLNLSVIDNLYGLAELSFKSKKEIKRYIDETIEEFDLSDIISLKGRQLSGGQRRKVEIARTLASKPKIILLDEPFAGIDPIAIDDIKNVLVSLSKKDIGILITDHNVRETLEICNNAAIINEGKIIAQGDANSLTKNDIVKRVYLGNMYS
jgi:lipopolysaccharide export system ATP-binding protein